MLLSNKDRSVTDITDKSVNVCERCLGSQQLFKELFQINFFNLSTHRQLQIKTWQICKGGIQVAVKIYRK